jgi:general secretion pathway protein L
MFDQLKDWRFWWVDMLRQLFTFRFEKSGAQGTAIIFQQGGLSVSSGIKRTQLESVSALLDLFSDSTFQRDYLKRAVDIQFENDTSVIRKLTNASMPESRHHAAAQLDMQASTPFRNSEFFALTVKPKSNVSGAFYSVVRRAELGQLLAGLKKANLKINTIKFEDRGQIFSATAAALKDLVDQKNGFLHQGKIALLAASLLMVPLTVANYSYQYGVAASKVERAIEPLALEAKALRVELDKRAALAAEMQALRKNIKDSKPAIAIWEELARVLPDSSFLTDLTITPEKVSIAGYTQSATAIIVALEASSIFDEVTFTSPVVKVPGRTDDRFSIDLKIGSK